MDVGVACADDYAVVAVEQEVAVETIGPGLHREQKTGQCRAVRNHRRRHGSVVNAVFDVAARPVDRCGEHRAEAATVCVGCREKRSANNPFSPRMTAVAVKTAKKTAALAPMLIKKTCR